MDDRAFRSKPRPIHHQQKEQREEARRLANWPLHLTDTRSRVHTGRTVNVSANGLMMSTHAKFAVGQKLLVSMDVRYQGTRKNLRCICEVRHQVITANGVMTGLRIKTIGEPCKSFLRQFAEQKM